MQLFDVIRIITTYIGPEGFKFPAQSHKAFKLEDGQFKGRATPQNVINWINKTQDNNNGGALLKLDVKGGYIEAGELYLFNDREIEGTKTLIVACHLMSIFVSIPIILTKILLLTSKLFFVFITSKL